MICTSSAIGIQLRISSFVLFGRKVWGSENGCGHRTLAMHRMEVGDDTLPRRSSRLLARTSSSLHDTSGNRYYGIKTPVGAVEHDQNLGQFYIEEMGRAYLEYERDGPVMRILHTEVPPELEGRGLGKILAKRRHLIVLGIQVMCKSCVLCGGQDVMCRTLSFPTVDTTLPRGLSRLCMGITAVYSAFGNRRYASDYTVVFVEHDPASGYFFINFEEGRAFLEYERDGRVIRILNTEVPPMLKGHGLGKILAKAALEYVARNDLPLEIKCDFVRHFVTKYEPKYIKYLQD